jgi:ABC-type transport system involved in multi-copper enzyme maturation permease subunit
VFELSEIRSLIPGPVCNFELLTTARRGRFYVMRAAYALVLLSIFWVVYAGWSAEVQNELTPKQMSWLAVICFCSVALAQMVLVLALTPALVAGVIADEKQRRTLHYLLASRLSGAEIVIGKLLARMLHVAVLLAVGLPVLSLLVLLGGIDPALVVLACGAAASTAWFLAALAIWVSTIARRAREALFIAYGLEFLWLFIPLTATWSFSVGWPVVDQIIETLTHALGLSGPIEPGRQFLFALMSAKSSPVPSLITMIECQFCAGAVLAALAAWQVRPVFRAQEGSVARWRWLRNMRYRRRSKRHWSRPALRDQPMLWKELFTSRARGFARLIAVLVTLVGGSFFLYYAIWFGLMAFLERRDQGDPSTGFNWYWAPERMKFYLFLRSVMPLVYLVGIFSVAGAAAASVTSEHEEDTWTSLTSTDLTGREIILSKLAGALWRPRGVVLVILLTALAGVVAGSLHPLSLPALGISLAIYGLFGAAFGVWISLHLRSTWRAQFLTISGLLLINIAGQAILSNVRWLAPMLWPGFTPYEISKTLLSPNIRQEWLNHLGSGILNIPALDDGLVWMTIFGILSLTCYLAGAIALTLLSLRKFEAVAGRARHRRSSPQ